MNAISHYFTRFAKWAAWATGQPLSFVSGDGGDRGLGDGGASVWV